MAHKPTVRRSLFAPLAPAPLLTKPKKAKGKPVDDFTVKPTQANTDAPAGEQPRLLFLDTGIKCGFAVLHPDGSMDSGVWQLDRGGRFDSHGMRMIRLQAFLTEMHKLTPLGMIAFEEVRRHQGVDAAHSYGALSYKIMEFATANQIPHQGIPVSAIKRTATGKGNAKKDKMCAAAKQRWPQVFTGPVNELDDNHADACWGAATVAQQLNYRIL